MAYQDINKVLGWENGPVTIAASAAVTADAATTAVEVGKGRLDLYFDVTASTLGEAPGSFSVVVESNSKDVPATWNQITPPILISADAESGGIAVADDQELYVPINNGGDNQIRISQYLNGNATSVTYSCVAYAVSDKDS